MFTNKRILVTGGTGSLGSVLVRRILTGEEGAPAKVVVFSRDEAKQHDMRLAFASVSTATDEIIYANFQRLLQFQIGDVRDYAAVSAAVQDSDIVVNAAALKQVPTCEYFPIEAVKTNIEGPQNIVRAVRESGTVIETVVGVSTDKACKPINVMGMTKALQERVFLAANVSCRWTRFICVRYGNVLASRGSVIPLFLHQIEKGGPVTITDERMTRFLLSLDTAVDTIFAAIRGGRRGETYVPRVSSARVSDVARALIGSAPIEIKITGIRPGEKLHEVLVSQEESARSIMRDQYYVIQPILPELCTDFQVGGIHDEYSSHADNLSLDQLSDLLSRNGLRARALAMA